MKTYNYDNYNKHLTLEERILIEKYLDNWINDGLTFTIIADSIGKDASTISKEIKKNLCIKEPSRFNNGFNQCAHKYDCKKRHLCNKDCKLKCSECIYCNSYCKDFEKSLCSYLKKPPYVCNCCPSFTKCKLEKHYYSATEAQSKYEYTLRDSREGINMTTEKFLKYEKALKDGLNKGQSFEATIYQNKDIPYSARTVYRHLEQNIFNNIKNIDLRNKVKFPKLKTRKKTPEEIALFRLLKKGRNYEDFQTYIINNPNASIVEMDTVIGLANEPYCFLTFYIRKACILLAFKLEEHTAKAVVEKLDEIYKALGQKLFKKLFEVILTDNGTEFSDVLGIETYENKKRCNLFYCDPMASGQKGRLENSHRLIRFIFPKKTSFKDVTQEQLTLACNNINNYPRRSLNGSTPYVLAKAFLTPSMLEVFGIKYINPNDVLLLPNLVK